MTGRECCWRAPRRRSWRKRATAISNGELKGVVYFNWGSWPAAGLEPGRGSSVHGRFYGAFAGAFAGSFAGAFAGAFAGGHAGKARQKHRPISLRQLKRPALAHRENSTSSLKRRWFTRYTEARHRPPAPLVEKTSSQIITATKLVRSQWTHPLTLYVVIVIPSFPRVPRDHHHRNGRDRTKTTTKIRVIHPRSAPAPATSVSSPRPRPRP